MKIEEVKKSSGIDWPVDETSKKSSMNSTGKKVWLESLKAVTDNAKKFNLDTNLVKQAQTLIEDIDSVPNETWQVSYVPLLHRHTYIMASSPSDVALEIARRGLEVLDSSMVIENDGQISTAKDAVFLYEQFSFKKELFGSLMKTGSKKIPFMKHFELIAPKQCSPQDSPDVLSSELMKDQIEKWVNHGCVEPSCLTSCSDVADIEDVASLVNDKVFVLFGATAEIGPMRTLLKIKGSTIVAIARPGPKIQALMKKVEMEATESVTVLFPSRKGSSGDEVIGADIIQDAPELAQWLTTLYPDKQLVLCCHSYMEGHKHVKVSVGMGLISEYICEHRKNTALSYLNSPSTVHLVPISAISDAQKKMQEITQYWHKPKNNPKLKPVNLHDYCIFNGLGINQGPHYALAKLSQHWRSLVARSKGHTVSSNFAPACRTDSMESRDSADALLLGMDNYPSISVFDAPTAGSFMAAMLLWDLNFKDKSSAHSHKKLEHPMCLFIENAAHGGTWRCPFDLESVGTFTYAMGKVLQAVKV